MFKKSEVTRICLGLLMALVLCFSVMAQQRVVAYRMQIDTSGRVYLMSQVTTRDGDTTLTTTKTIRFDSAALAVPVVEDLQRSIAANKANLQQLWAANVQNEKEVTEIGQALTRLQTTGSAEPPPPATPQDYDKLKAEYEALKAKIGKDGGG